jgi:hypothetical protein
MKSNPKVPTGDNIATGNSGANRRYVDGHTETSGVACGRQSGEKGVRAKTQN